MTVIEVRHNVEVFNTTLSTSIIDLLVFTEKKILINIADFTVTFRMWQPLRSRPVGGVTGSGGGSGALRSWVKDWMRWTRKSSENFTRQPPKYRLK